MPKIPTLQTAQRPNLQSVGPTATPGPDRAGDALQDIGKSVQGFAKAVRKKQDRDNLYMVEDSVNILSASSRDLETRYSEKKSGDVAKNSEFFEDEMERFDDEATRVGEGLKNEEQIAMFNRRIAVARLHHGGKLTTHIASETDTFHGQVYVATQESNVDMATSNVMNPAIVDMAVLNAGQSATAEADRLGYEDPTLRHMFIKNAGSIIHVETINEMLDSKNPKAAKEWYGQHKKEINGKEHGAIEKLLASEGMRERTQEAVEEWVLTKTRTEAKEAARNKFDGADEDMAIKRIDERYGEIRKARLFDQAEASDQAEKLAEQMIDGQICGMDCVPPSLREKLSGAAERSMRVFYAKEAAGKKVVTNIDAYFELMSIKNDRANPHLWEEVDLREWKDRIGGPLLIKEINEKLESKPGTGIFTRHERIVEAGEKVGLRYKDRVDVKASKGDKLKAKAFYYRLDMEFRAREEILKRKLTPDEIDSLSNAMSVKLLRDPEGFWENTWLFVRSHIPAKSFQVMKVSQGAAWEGSVEGVPNEDVLPIIEALQKMNREPTKEAIQMKYKFDNMRKSDRRTILKLNRGDLR